MVFLKTYNRLFLTMMEYQNTGVEHLLQLIKIQLLTSKEIHFITPITPWSQQLNVTRRLYT